MAAKKRRTRKGPAKAEPKKKPVKVTITITQGARKLAQTERSVPTTATQWAAWVRRCKEAAQAAKALVDAETKAGRIK